MHRKVTCATSWSYLGSPRLLHFTFDIRRGASNIMGNQLLWRHIAHCAFLSLALLGCKPSNPAKNEVIGLHHYGLLVYVEQFEKESELVPPRNMRLHSIAGGSEVESTSDVFT